MAESDEATDDNIIRRMRIACWITKGPNRITIVDTYCFFIATIVKRKRLDVT